MPKTQGRRHGRGKSKELPRPNEGVKPVAADEDGTFYEVEEIIGKRKYSGRIQYLVKWKGCPVADSTWERADNLCESAYEEARQFSQRERKKRRFAEQSVADLDSEASHTKSLVSNCRSPPDNSRLYPIRYRHVERFDAQHAETPRLVREARENGIPVVLFNHDGWANFAKAWVRPYRLNGRDTRNSVGTTESETVRYKVDIAAMIRHIGKEVVPILKHDYNEAQPIKHNIIAEHFLRNYWPNDDDDDDDDDSHDNVNNNNNNHHGGNQNDDDDSHDNINNGSGALHRKQSHPRPYLHQWQFPLSGTACHTLCRDDSHHPLPNNILGQDLLQYWLDNGVNPYQYIFMGDEDTASKMHVDKGGLDILISPIVGKKECILLHRFDGDQGYCEDMADLSTGYVDIERHPLACFARIWRTVVEPGEILLLPQGTYHQCKNITPCLSYSRFHLDTTNIPGFLDSLFLHDAPEMEHDDVIWNCVSELTNKIINFDLQRRRRTGHTLHTEVPTKMRRIVADVRRLRCICSCLVGRLRRTRKRIVFTEKKGELPQWETLIDDIDKCLALVSDI